MTDDAGRSDDAGATAVAPSRSDDEAAKRAASRLRKFAGEHGGVEHAFLQYVSVNRTRIVVVCQDGRWGDQVVDSYEEAQAVAAAAEFEVEDDREWSREATAAVKTTGYEWGKMGRGRPADR